MDDSYSDIYLMIVSVTIVLIILLGFIVSFLFIYKNKQMRHQREMESVKERYNQEILRTQLEIREQTLKNISEEIHDNVGQVLSLAVLSLSAIDLTNILKATDKIEHITKLVEKSVADLRNLSKSMDPDTISSLGLANMIKFEIDLLEKTGVYQTSLDISGNERRLNREKEIIVYRIVQESLNNIIKHARASFIKIDIHFFDLQLAIQVSDNGKGFADNQAYELTKHPGGSGLKNMTKRARLIGGTIAIKSVPSNGTIVSLSIPYN